MKHYVLFTKIPSKSGSQGNMGWITSAKETNEIISFESIEALQDHVNKLDQENTYLAYELVSLDPIQLENDTLKLATKLIALGPEKLSELLYKLSPKEEKTLIMLLD